MYQKLITQVILVVQVQKSKKLGRKPLITKEVIMKVIYLRNTHDAKKGDIKNINDLDAKALIALKLVSKYIKTDQTNTNKVAKKSKSKVKD